MCVRLSSLFRRISRGWVALVALAVFLLFTATVLPAESARAEEASGGSASPDLSLWYTPAELYAMAEAYGPEGRAAYVRARLTFDVVWPLVYTAFMTSTIAWAFGRALPPASRWQLVNLVPGLAMMLDFLENLSAALVMARYPAHTPAVDALAPVLTLLKWALVGGAAALMVVGLTMALVWWIRARRVRVQV